MNSQKPIFILIAFCFTLLLLFTVVTKSSAEIANIFVERFESDLGFTQTDPDIYIANNLANWTFQRNQGSQYIYRNIPPFSGDVRLTVSGQIDSANSNCYAKAGIGDTIGSGASVNFGFYGAGCPPTYGSYVITAQGASLDYYESSCTFLGNWLWITAGTQYTATLTLENGAASLTSPGVGTSVGTQTYNGDYSVLYVGNTGDGDWPSCSGSIDTMIIEPLGGGGDEIVWNGSVDNNWANNANWTPNQIPNSTNSVIIPVSSIRWPEISGDAAVYDINIEANAELSILETGNLTVENVVINNGTLFQTQNVGASSNVSFLQLQPSGGGEDRYRGVDIITDSNNNLGSTTVRIMGNTSVCNNNDGGNYRNRCFMINPSNSGSAIITLHTTQLEDDINDDAFYQHNSGNSWTEGAVCNDPIYGGGSCTYTGTFSSPSYFLIGSQSSTPTAVTLNSISIERNYINLTIFISLIFLGILSVVVFSRRHLKVS